jgi:hypothetical protein
LLGITFQSKKNINTVSVKAFKRGASVNRIPSENNPVIVHLHCGHAIVLLFICWLKTASKKMFATCIARDLSRKINWFNFVRLSRVSIIQRIEGISDNLLYQPRNKLEEFGRFLEQD